MAGASFVAGLSLPHQHADDAASLLQLARADSYEFCITSLPLFSVANTQHNDTGVTVCPSLPRPRHDVTTMESKWWSTSVVGEVKPTVTLTGDQMLAQVDTSKIPPHTLSSVTFTTADNALQAAPQDSVHHQVPAQELRLVEGLISPVSAVRKTAEQAFFQMLRWAAHMNIPAVILPALPPKHTDEQSSAYARLLATLAAESSTGNVQLWLRVSFDSESMTAYDTLYHKADMPSNLGCIICMGGGANSSPDTDQSSVALSSIHLLHRFVGCNTRAIGFDSSIFLTNKRGYPTFSKSLQILFTTLLRRLGKTLRVIVEGGQRHFPPPPVMGDPMSSAGDGNPNGGTGCLAYLQYLRHLRSRAEVVATLDTPDAEMETSYLDQLQSPLQPLADDLEFSTYETFEKDPVKYTSYQSAIECCVQDMLNQPGVLDRICSTLGGLNNTNSGMWRNRYPYTHKVTIMVVGAGRGPLVNAALTAVEAVNCRTVEELGSTAGSGSLPLVRPHVIALEKNASAVLFLKSLQHHGGEVWNESDTTVVHGDIRNVTPEVAKTMRTSTNEAMASSVDIVVSELLGSFGDNELSPECLQACGRSGLLKDCTSVSIPQSYRSYIAPVSSMRLHAEIKAQAYSPTDATNGPGGQPFGTLRAMETPYVVRPYAASQICVEQPCFEFQHVGNINTSANTEKDDNEKYIQVDFPSDPTVGVGCGCGYGRFDSAVSALAQNVDLISVGGEKVGTTVHGFLGSFEAILYRPLDIKVSPIMISTAPSSFSTGMFSWFPLLFPLKEPIHLPPSAGLRMNMWRRTEGSRVWYEWCAEIVQNMGGYSATVSRMSIHNPNGRSYHVSL
jgi:protein arginine N-methyltransferase 5